MNRTYFRAKLTGGTIAVPLEVARQFGGEEVEVSISPLQKELSPNEDGLTYFLKHPLKVENFVMPTKDEMHSRD